MLDDRDPVLRSHEDGDADGLGFARGCLIAAVILGLFGAACFAIYFMWPWPIPQ